jgi:hypothetical protein
MATAYPDLNAVLDRFVAGVREALGENCVGVYLQGSFAVGDADENSDVDFIVVTRDDLTDGEIARLQALHEAIFALASPWAQHLEGSYISDVRLRHVDPARRPLLYLDNGATELVWDNHCNTAVVRWSLRERGVRLYGPHPKSLVAPVSASDLVDDVRHAADEWADWLGSNQLRRRAQSVLVLSLCRMLHTLVIGRVTSKREAGEWALGTLDGEWSSLIRAALEDRPDPWSKVSQPADPKRVQQTLALLAYVRNEVRQMTGTRRE